MTDNIQESPGQYPGWGSYEQQAPLDEAAIKEAFNAFAEPGLQEVKTENIPKLVQYLRLPIPDNLDKLTLSVAEGSRSLSYAAVRTLCGLIYGKGPLIESSNKAKQDHKKKCEKEGKYMEARTAAKRLHDLKVRWN
eukprot:6057802-Pyramimonas_sp.AAC.1